VFWVQRLKTEEQDANWAISYGDMMSLLMAVFVMIAAMSELRPGGRFASVSTAVQSAFGFVVEADRPQLRLPRPLTLPEQLARAGLITTAAATQPELDESLRCCDVRQEHDRVVIEIAGAAAFDPFSAALKPQAQAAIERLGYMLRSGRAQVEVRGHSGDGPPGGSTMYRDALDLSYGRARCVVDALTQSGVKRSRVFVSACGDQDPLIAQNPPDTAAAANRRVEIVVHAVKVQEGTIQFAEKGQR
jgi:chemotaxis protein MotB